MEITLDKKSNIEGLIKIKLSEVDYQPQVEEKMRDYARKANLKGFRPGKVPTGVIRKMFGKSIKVDEINHLVNHKISDFIKEKNLRILGDPLPDREKALTIDWDNQKDFEFEYHIGMVDEFKYDLSPKIKIKSYPIKLEEKTVDETVVDLQKRYGKVSYPEASEAGDALYGTLKSADGTWQKEGALIHLENVRKSEQSKFLGRKKEDVISFDIEKLYEDTAQLDELLSVEGVPGPKKGEFNFTVVAVSRIEPANLGQDLYDRVFGKNAATDENSFREKIRETINDNYKRETEHYLSHTIEDELVHHTKINIPEAFLKTWLKTVDENNQITEDVLEREFNSYSKNLKWDLIKNKIAEDNQIKVEAEEVKAKATELIISQFGGPEFANQIQDKLDGIVQNYLSHENGKNFMRLYNQLRDEKIMSHIKNQITVDENPVNVEGFRKIVTEHQHA